MPDFASSPPRDDADPWMTVREIADEFKANIETVRLWMTRGRLPAVRAGRKWLARRSDVLQFIGVPSDAPPDRPAASLGSKLDQRHRPPASASRLTGNAPGLAERAGG
jgi:excisionase family DNA binding protein